MKMFSERFPRFSVLAVAACMTFVAACGGDDGGGESSTAKDGGTTAVADVPFSGSVEDGVQVGVPAPKKQSFTIGMSTGLGSNEYLKAVETAARLETQAMGGRFVVLDAQGSPDKQVTHIQQLIARKVDAILLTPLDVGALGPPAKQAKAAKIPIFGQDLNLEDTKVPEGFTGQVWQRRDYLSYLQAQQAAKAMPAGSSFGQIGFTVKVPTIERALTRATYWADKFGLKAAGRADNRTDDIAGGAQAMTQLMSSAPDMKGVIAYNDESATGAASSARSAGKEFVLVGVNGGSVAYNSVRSGRITASVQINAPDVGRFLVWSAYHAAAGEKTPETVMTEPPVALNADTVDKVPTWEDVFESRYGKAK